MRNLRSNSFRDDPFMGRSESQLPPQEREAIRAGIRAYIERQQISDALEGTIRQYFYETPISGEGYKRHAKELTELVMQVLDNVAKEK